MAALTLCRLCHAHGRQTPVFATAAGALIRPICDRNIPHRPTRKDS